MAAPATRRTARHREHAAGGRHEQEVAGGQRPEHQREAGRAVGAAAQPDRQHPAQQGARAPDSEQRAGGGRAAEPVGGRGDGDLDRPEQRADRHQHDHQRAHGRRPQGAAARPRGAAVGAPRPRRRLSGEGGRADEQDRAGEHQRGSGRPEGAEPEGEWGPADPGQLRGGGLDRVGRAHRARVGKESREQVRRQAPSGGVASPIPAARPTSTGNGRRPAASRPRRAGPRRRTRWRAASRSARAGRPAGPAPARRRRGRPRTRRPPARRPRTTRSGAARARAGRC